MFSKILTELEEAFTHIKQGNHMQADFTLTRQINKLKAIQKHNKVKVVRHLKKNKHSEATSRLREYLVQDDLRDHEFGGVVCKGMSEQERQRAERFQRSKNRGKHLSRNGGAWN